MSIKTINIEDLGDELGNRYELLAVISKRARQIAAREKLELDEKLKYFVDDLLSDDLTYEYPSLDE
jgi:DNA-directed RNA polymerase omega subunit